MVFKMRAYHVAAYSALLFFALSPGTARAQDWFEGIYITLRAGPLMPHPGKERIDLDDRMDESLRADAGFAAASSFGVWLRFLDQARFRSEVEISYQRFELEMENRPFGLRRDEGRGSGDYFIFLWNNYVNFSPPILSGWRHQIWAGWGIGGARHRRNFYYLRPYKPPPETDLALTAMIGYDFRLTRDLAIGAHYRYLHIFDFPSSHKQSQLIFGLTYGF